MRLNIVFASATLGLIVAGGFGPSSVLGKARPATRRPVASKAAIAKTKAKAKVVKPPAKPVKAKPKVAAPSAKATKPAAKPAAPAPGSVPPKPVILASKLGNAAAGATVYAQNCQGCHGATGRANRPGRPDFSSAEWQSRHSDEVILDAIKNGHGRMPAFGDRLTVKEQRDVAAYVRALKVAEGPR